MRCPSVNPKNKHLKCQLRTGHFGPHANGVGSKDGKPVPSDTAVMWE